MVAIEILSWLNKVLHEI